MLLDAFILNGGGVSVRRKVISCVICALMISVISVIEVPKDVSAQVTEEWVARYDGPGNGPANDWDWGEAVAIDPSGNIYVTGYSYGNGTRRDYVTIKYDSAGNELWVARYNGPRNRWEEALDIGIDSLGDIYITGRSEGGYVTIKYNSEGNELWVAKYNGPNNKVDDVYAMALDSYGNVYVTGYSCSDGGGSDFATVAYNSSGTELWTARYVSPGNNYDKATDITTDQFGNIYVTGYSSENSTDDDFVTIAYDHSGNELWISRYNGPGNKYDYARAIATDLKGNVYVVGSSFNNLTINDFITVAYDSSGNELWMARYDGPGHGDDFPLDITTDSLGNIYITGYSHGHNTDYATIAYDSTGNQLWVARYNGPGNEHDFPFDMALDTFGNVLVTGRSQGCGTYEDIATVAYDSSGNEIWVARYSSLGNGPEGGHAIATDQLGNVYVTGYSSSSRSTVSYDIITIKYSQKSFLPTMIDIDPDTINLKSKGRWITCYIDLPDNDVNDIDISTIHLEDTIPAQWGDIQGDTLMVKFDRSEVEDMLSPGTYNLKVSGELVDGTGFEGYSDEIRVIEPG
jgi:uncharacterized delta-60 repeat protein